MDTPDPTQHSGLLSPQRLAEIRHAADQCDDLEHTKRGKWPRRTRCRQCATILTLLAHIHLADDALVAVRAELDEETGLRERLATLLTETCDALKGAPPEDTAHSWHDLPEIAAAVVASSTTWDGE